MEQALEDALQAQGDAKAVRACVRRFLWDTLRTLPRTWVSSLAASAGSRGRVVAFLQDTHYAARGLRKDVRFTAAAVATLALAIAANASMVSVIDRVALGGPAHVDAPGELVRIYTKRSPSDGRTIVTGWQPYTLYTHINTGVASFSAVGATAPDELMLGLGVDARPIPVTWATHDFFTLTGVAPVVGRFYGSDEDQPPQGAQVAVLGYGLWQRGYHGDPEIVGQPIRLDGREFVVIGVAPPGFTGLGTSRVDAWLPMAARNPGAQPGWDSDWRSSPASIVGRLIGPSAVAETALTNLLHRRYNGPTASMLEADVELHPTTYAMDGTEPRELALARLLTALALAMLAIAAANMSNLVLARSIRRRQELGVRAALGAGRGRIVRLVVLESVLVAAVGGAVGLLVHHLGGGIIERTLMPEVPWNEIPTVGRVALWTALAALAAGLLAGLIAPLSLGRSSLMVAFRGARRDSGGSPGSLRGLQTSLQVVQLALSLVLVFTAGVFVKSVRAVEGVDLGYDSGKVVAVDIAFPPPDSVSSASRSGSTELLRSKYEELEARFTRLPSVESTSVAFAGPLSSVSILRIRLPGGEPVPPEAAVTMVSAVSEGYFKTVGTPIVRGNALPPEPGGEPVVVISESLAHLLWPGENAVGHCVLLRAGADAPCERVVGVAADARQVSPTEASFAQIYIPWGSDPRFLDGSVVLVRTSRPIEQVLPMLRADLAAQEPDLRWATIKSWREALEPAVRPWRVIAVLFTLFGGLATAVAALGLFSVASYLTALRSHEFGVRIVLGARTMQVIREALRSSVELALAGIILGGLLVVAIGPVLQPLLFENRAWDPGLMLRVAVTLLAVVLLAAFSPSWRAAKVNPIRAIRAE